MGNIRIYTLTAAGKRLGKSLNALRQAIKQLRYADLPLEIGPFEFIMLGTNGYIAIEKGVEIEIID